MATGTRHSQRLVWSLGQRCKGKLKIIAANQLTRRAVNKIRKLAGSVDAVATESTRALMTPEGGSLPLGNSGPMSFPRIVPGSRATLP